MRYIIAAISVVYMAYFITSNVIRFQHTGRVCAGDFGNPFPPMTPLLNHTEDINERTIVVDDDSRLLAVVVPPKEQKKNYLVVVEGDFIKTNIIVNCAFFAFMALLALLIKLRKYIK